MGHQVVHCGYLADHFSGLEELSWEWVLTSSSTVLPNNVRQCHKIKVAIYETYFYTRAIYLRANFEFPLIFSLNSHYKLVLFIWITIQAVYSNDFIKWNFIFWSLKNNNNIIVVKGYSCMSQTLQIPCLFCWNILMLNYQSERYTFSNLPFLLV